MNNKPVTISVLKENVSDDSYLVVGFHVDSGTKVTNGQPLLELESSKAVFDVIATTHGFVHMLIAVGNRVLVGDPLCVISESATVPQDVIDGILQDGQSMPSATEGGLRISKAARNLIDEHKVDTTVFAGKKFVTEKDVRRQIELSNSSLPDWRKLVADFSGELPLAVLWGAGGHARMCLDILQQLKTHAVIGLVANPRPAYSELFGIPYIGGDDLLPALYEAGVHTAFLGIGVTERQLREKLYQRLIEIGFKVPTIIHPRAVVENSSQLGDGNQIMAGAIVGSAVVVGNNCILNSGSIVSHDSVIADGVHIAPGAILAGAVEVGQNSLVGMGATVFLRVKIGKNVIINNGCHIVSDVFDDQVVRR